MHEDDERMVRLELRVNSLEKKVIKLETNVDNMLKKLDKIEGNTSKIIWLIFVIIVYSIFNLILKGGVVV